MSAINADPEVVRWIGDGSIRDVQQTKAGIEASQHEWNVNGFGLFALEMRTTGELTGFTGPSVPSFLPEVMPAVEIGWRLGRRSPLRPDRPRPGADREHRAGRQ